VRLLGSEILAHSHTCRYRFGVSRHIMLWWFRGGVGAVVNPSELFWRCHRRPRRKRDARNFVA